jgi:metallo-beta-lactamase family protein
VKDAEKAASLFSVVRYGETVRLKDTEAEFFDAGHILGSASIRVRLHAAEATRTVLFSGDIGRWDRPIIKDPSPCDSADYVLMESTYGDRLHGDSSQIAAALQTVVSDTVGRGGNIVIPSFAIERSQDVLYYLNELLRTNKIPHLLVFLDSPMATTVTEIFSHWPDYFDADMLRLIQENRSPFDLPGLVMARSSEESKAINRITGSAIIIAGAGMCTGGRIKHHLVRNIARSQSTILFVGYQAEGTLGRQIVEGAHEVRILGERFPVKAQVKSLQGFSGHADKGELLRWASCLTRKPSMAYIIHGEAETAAKFAKTLEEEKGWSAIAPMPGQSVEIA